MLFLFTFILTAVRLTQSNDWGGGGVLFRWSPAPLDPPRGGGKQRPRTISESEDEEIITGWKQTWSVRLNPVCSHGSFSKPPPCWCFPPAAEASFESSRPQMKRYQRLYFKLQPQQKEECDAAARLLWAALMCSYLSDTYLHTQECSPPSQRTPYREPASDWVDPLLSASDERWAISD